MCCFDYINKILLIINKILFIEKFNFKFKIFCSVFFKIFFPLGRGEGRISFRLRSVKISHLQLILLKDLRPMLCLDLSLNLLNHVKSGIIEIRKLPWVKESGSCVI